MNNILIKQIEKLENKLTLAMENNRILSENIKAYEKYVKECEKKDKKLKIIVQKLLELELKERGEEEKIT
jgi:hypothetical protein